jgi:hypothetical protein
MGSVIASCSSRLNDARITRHAPTKTKHKRANKKQGQRESVLVNSNLPPKKTFCPAPDVL